MTRNSSYDLGNPFRNSEMGPHYENDELVQMLKEARPDIDGCVFAAVYIGIQLNPDKIFKSMTFQEYYQLCMAVHDRGVSCFRQENIGFELCRGLNHSQMMGVFPKNHADDFPEYYLHPIAEQLEEEYGIRLCIGVGLQTDQLSQLKNSYKTSQYAFDLYFFEPGRIIAFQNIHKDFYMSPDEYYDRVEDAFRAILSRDEHTLDRIVSVVDLIGSIHYGNWRAVVMRTMDYTGILVSRLFRYHLLDGDFFSIQNCLQDQVFCVTTLDELKDCILRHFSELLPQVYKTERSTGKAVIEKVKTYMEENYMENLTIKELSDIACVSVNYFSHMFKRETGKNYKTYLTEIRMQKAQDLLIETDFMVYEISEMVGYNNTRTFVDAFKQSFDMSPMEFRIG